LQLTAELSFLQQPVAKERAVKHNLDKQKFDACVKKQDESAVRASMAASAAS